MIKNERRLCWEGRLRDVFSGRRTLCNLCVSAMCLLSYVCVCVCACGGLQMDHASLLKQFEHLDPHNQNTFEAKDLELLITTVTSSREKLMGSCVLTRFKCNAEPFGLKGGG